MESFPTETSACRLVHLTVCFSGYPGAVVDKRRMLFICMSDGVLSNHILLVPVVEAGLGEVREKTEGGRETVVRRRTAGAGLEEREGEKA